MRHSLRSAALVVALLAIAYPSFGQPDAAQESEAGATSRAQFDRDEARWADLEAQRRATDGDYDGAVQAHQQAEQDSQAADRQMLEQGRR